MKRSATLLLFAFSICASRAQITITDSLDVSGIAGLLQGFGVTVSNVAVNCAPNAMGHFSGSSELAIGQGLMLTTGCAACVADSSGAFVNGTNNTGGDADLEMDLGMAGITMDACALEFDCVPVGDTLLFNFSFGSEEYPEYVGSSFNDAFAIYINGPGFLTQTNVAAIPAAE